MPSHVDQNAITLRLAGEARSIFFAIFFAIALVLHR
jgi:hypothetical protein